MTDMEVDGELPSLVDDSQSTEKKKVDKQQNDEADDARDAASLVRRALFAAVEGGFDDNMDDDDVHSFRPLLRLFLPSKSTRSIKPGASARELKDLLLDTVKTFHKGYARRFFAGLKPIVKQVIDDEAHVPDAAYQDEDESGTAASASVAMDYITPDAKSSRALQFLLHTTQLLQAYLEAQQDKLPHTRKSHVGQSISIISEAVEVAELLHGILLDVHACGPDAVPVQSALLTLFENWWLANATQRESLMLHTLPLLVTKAVGVDGKPPLKSDIKRLLRIQDAFHELDFSHEGSDVLRSVLLKFTSSPLCLKVHEGKKFITGLFRLDPGLVSDLHQAMRVQMPQQKKPILKIYGEIYKKAWKESNNSDNCPEEIQAAIEEDVLQDLMYAALHIANPRMSKILLLVLEPFHEGKKASDIEGLLYRMYGPILWRALTAANYQVRINAAVILGEVFPLQEPSHVQADAAFKKGAQALKALLKDKHPKVRVAASNTVAKVLATYWDVLATDDIRSLLNLVVSKHASDATSYHVRVGALKAVTLLLDSPQCHAVLRALLPSMGNLIHDKNKSVRLAAVDMLLKVKTVKRIKYYHVVPVDHLRARLADEGRLSSLSSKAYNPLLYTSPVASGLTRLMLNSYVPQGPDVSAVDQIKRTLSFLATDPDAAAVFYANLADHLSPMAIAKLASMLLRCVTAAIETEKKKAKQTKNTSVGKKRNKTADDSDSESDEESDESDYEGDKNSSKEDTEEVMLTASNTSFMADLSEVIASLWESIFDELDYEENDACHHFLVKTFSGTTLTDMLGYFEQQARALNGKNDGAQDDYCRIHSAILRCAGFLEPKDVEGLVSHITKSMQALNANNVASRSQQQMPTTGISDHFALLCLWGMTEDVATSLSASILSAFDDDDHDGANLSLLSPVSDKSKKRKGSRGGKRKSSVKNSLVPLLPPEVAIQVLNEILHGSDPGNITAREAMMATIKARETLEQAFEIATQCTGRFFRAAAVQAQAINDTQVLFMLIVCEAFGRFSLHKAAFNAIEEGAMLELNMEAKHLLEWTTEQIVPAVLTEGKGIPLQELDLSRISFGNTSMVEMELDETLDDDPQSPGLTPLAPPRKKGNRNATPERLDTGLQTGKDKESKRKDSKIIPGDSTAVLVRLVSCGLLQSSCLVFSEWLSVGAGSGAKMILEAALKWCSILDARTKEEADNKENKKADDKLKSFQMDLLPAFFRLSATLGASASDFRLLKVLLHKLPRMIDEAENEHDAKIKTLVQDTVSSLLKSSACEGAVATVMEFIYDMLPHIEAGDQSNVQGEEEEFELPTTTYDLVCPSSISSSSADVAASALHAMVSHNKGSLLLAEILLKNLTSNVATEGEAEKKKVMLEAKCLWFLWDSSKCSKTTQFRAIVRKLSEVDQTNKEFFGEGSQVSVMIQQMIDPEESAPKPSDAA